MIERVGLLLEGISIVICLHCLYGEKFKLNIVNTSYLVLHMIIMATINYYDLNKIYTFLIYPFIVLYCGVRFGFKWRELIINNILYLVLIGIIQLVVAISYAFIFAMLPLSELNIKNKELLIINGGVLLFVTLIFPRLKISRLSTYLQDKERILVISLIFCIVLTIWCLTNFKMVDGLKGYQNLMLLFSISIFFILAGQLGKYKIKSKEVETELRMHKLFSDSFHSLIEDIRVRQHEFDNHINAIYSLQYTCESFDELVNAQNEYSQLILKENRYNKLLKAGNPLLIGFLYGKFLESEKLGITVAYQISIGDLNVNIPVYKLIEILGNLIKNAVEAMKDKEDAKEMFVSVIENNGLLEVEVRNKGEVIDYNEIDSFFKKGFSKKGHSRGLGLYNVKNICNEYALRIFCENKVINKENWFCFTISNKKETT